MKCEMCSAPDALPCTIYDQRVHFCATCARDLEVERDHSGVRLDVVFSGILERFPVALPDVTALESYPDPMSLAVVLVGTVTWPDGTKRGDIHAKLTYAEMRSAREPFSLFRLMLTRLEAARADLLSKGIAA